MKLFYNMWRKDKKMKVFRMELKRSIYNIGMLVSIILGLACIFIKQYGVCSRIIESNKILRRVGGQSYTGMSNTPFITDWVVMMIEPGTIYLLYMFGLIVALPYGISYYRDKKIGLIKNICTRTNHSTYLRAKYFATFISGGIAIIIPLLADLLMAKLWSPRGFHGNYIKITGTVLSAATMWGKFTIDHYYIVALVYILLWFIFGGVLATITLVVSSYTENVFTIQLMPFFVMLILFYFPSYMIDLNINKFLPSNFLSNIEQSNPLYGMLVSAILMVFTYSVYMRKEKKMDIL